MTSVRPSQPIPSAGWTTALCLLIGLTAAYIWFYPISMRAIPERKTPTTPQGVHLSQVYASEDEANAKTYVDIIAIHGLDTQSPETWTWRTSDPNNCINWLAHPRMLPSKVGVARIFTCDWPAGLLQPSNSAQKTTEEYALYLLNGIQAMRSATSDAADDRPILFIASCLGGIVLMNALIQADNKQSGYTSLRRATRGIIFLATPFRGTSFQDVAFWAEPGLTVWALVRGLEVSKLLGRLKGSTSGLEATVRRFTQLCQDENSPIHVFNFYELQKTSLLRKVFPWLPSSLNRGKLLVDRGSATLDIVPEPLPLDRPHVLTNKFADPECADYQRVAGKIGDFLQKIREGTLLSQADAWIRENHYTEDRLKIERISGDVLSMDQCYINLAVIMKTAEAAPTSSPFSLAARLRVEMPDESIPVDLPKLFNPRKEPDGRATEPRRILIRGRAGMGKTTLCKKIVNEFINDKWSEWTALFDRILWVPLRNLKSEPKEGYNLEGLFSQELFSQSPKRRDLVKKLWDTLETTNFARTLFVLDGLDEVSEGLSKDNKMFEVLRHLLTRPNIIITCRPHVSCPQWLNIDLELETVGFYPDQVDEYLRRAAFKESNEASRLVGEVKVFLQGHPLVESLVRIPVQLDALCYSWEDGSYSTSTLESMTAVYEAIELRLWKKDIYHLQGVDPQFIRNSRTRPEIENWVETEMRLLEFFAFSGIWGDVIDYSSKHRDAVYRYFNQPRSSVRDASYDDKLATLSFLRTSDPSLENRHTSYHFLHLTFQEYFAARYFAQKWKSREKLRYLVFNNGKPEEIRTEPASFLRKHKYTARYSILWRFVAGLLDAEGIARDFFEELEKEPRDLLGPAHQRLVMQCLSEVSTGMPLRKKLEKSLGHWLLFECKSEQTASLAAEAEFPEEVLLDVLQERSGVESRILRSLRDRPTIPSSIFDLVPSWLGDSESPELKRATLELLQKTSHGSLSKHILLAVARRLADSDVDVKETASHIIRNLPAEVRVTILPDVDTMEAENWEKWVRRQTDLSNEVIARVRDLEDENRSVRLSALYFLKAQHETWLDSLPDNAIALLVCYLEDENSDIRRGALSLLRAQYSLPDNAIAPLVCYLENKDSDIRKGALSLLGAQKSLSDNAIASVVCCLEDKNLDVRSQALRVLEAQKSLSDNAIALVVCCLEDENSDIRWEALGVLGSFAIASVVCCLKDENDDVRRWAFLVLQRQSSLPDKVVAAAVCGLEDEDMWVKYSVLYILRKQSSLPHNAVAAMVCCLEDENSQSVLKSRIFDLLAKQSSLPDNAIAAAVCCLEDENWGVRMTALGILQTLSDEVIMATKRRLESTGRLYVESLPRRHEGVFATILSSQLGGSLFRVLLERSFYDQWSCRVEDSICYLNTADGQVLRWEVDDKDAFMSMIAKYRPLGYPSKAEV